MLNGHETPRYKRISETAIFAKYHKKKEKRETEFKLLRIVSQKTRKHRCLRARQISEFFGSEKTNQVVLLCGDSLAPFDFEKRVIKNVSFSPAVSM